MDNASLYFHGACFDGLVSGILAQVFLETEGWQFTALIPTSYAGRNSWLSVRLKVPAAVVDFLYHPDAFFWADHHSTTFLTIEAREDFQRRRASGFLLFDERSGSCAQVLWGLLRTRLPGLERFREAVHWAEKIDTARYSSIDEAICGDSPALRIKQSLSVSNDVSFYDFLFAEMRSGDLEYVAALPPVRQRFEEVRRKIRRGLQRAQGHVSLTEGVAIADVNLSDDDILSRYAPYHFFPEARYSISVLRSASGITITAMRNPWIDFCSIPLGRVLEVFGGGGHERVGSVLVPTNDSERAHKIVGYLVSQMRAQSPVESATYD